MENKSILHSKLGVGGWLEQPHLSQRPANSIKFKNVENIIAYLRAIANAAVYVCRENSNICIVGQVEHGISQSP